MFQITRKFTFDSGHRVWGHGGKCAHLHGHRYEVEVHLQAPELDKLGCVVDFGVMKELFGGYIDAYWDHTVLLNSDDPLARVWAVEQADDTKRSGLFLPGKSPVLFNQCNPTAENIAAALYREFQCLLQTTPDVGFHSDGVMQVRVHETEKCSAIAEGYTPFPLIMSYVTGEVNPAASMTVKAPPPEAKLTDPPAIPANNVVYVLEGQVNTGQGSMRERGIQWQYIAATTSPDALNKIGAMPAANGRVRGKALLLQSAEEFEKTALTFLTTK